MTYFSYLRAGLLSTALLLTTALASPALAENLPEISPRQIAGDVKTQYNSETGVREYIAPTFDPFEEDKTMAGTASLRSVSNAVAIDGQSVRGGALLDLTFYYSSPTSDPYDIRGYEEAVFLSGEYAPVTLRDNRVLDCSEKVSETIYHHDSYYSPSLYLNFYRPYRHYGGHYRYGHSGYGNRYGHAYRRGHRGYRRGSRGRHHDGYRGRRHRDNDGILDRVVREVTGEETSRRRNRRGDDVHRDRDRDVVTPRTGRRNDRTPRTPVRPSRREIDSRANPRPSVGRSNNPRSLTGRIARDVEDRIDRADRVSPRPNAARRNNGRRNSGPRTTRPVRVAPTPRAQVRVPRPAPAARPPTVRPPAPVARPAPAPRPAPAARPAPPPKAPAARRPARVDRAVDRTFRSKNPKRNFRKGLDFFPKSSSWSRRAVTNVNTQCAREERLSVHIPQERLDASRFDGLTVFVLDRAGREIPVYIPPNYVEGFRQAVAQGGSGGGIKPTGLPYWESDSNRQNPAPIYRAPRPAIETAPCPTGTMKQDDGTCLTTSNTYGGYPRR